MGTKREQSSGEVLHVDGRGSSSPARRNRGLESSGVRDCRCIGHDIRGGVNVFKRFRSFFRVLTRRRDFEDGMSEELRFHIEQWTDDLVRSGMSREKAARLIRIELGSLDNIKADCRETFGVHLFGEPGSTERLQTVRVSPDFFSTLALGPAIGRTFTDQETTSETDHVAILSDTFWRQRYNGDPNIIGRQIRVNSVPRTVIGVLPPAFRFLSSDARLFLPLASRPEDRTPLQRHSGGNVTQMIARLKPGATVAQAQSQIDAQNATLEADDPQAKMIADAGFRSIVVSLHAEHVAAIRPTLLLLQAGAIALLLIGAVNLVNLLLVRASSRVKELAVRQALGASRGYVVSEAVVETTLLTLAGGLLGLAVCAGGIHLLRIFGADRLPLGGRIAFDARLALLALVGAILMGIVFALPIAWFNLRRHLGNALQSESRGGTSGRAAQILRHSFIVSQIALAFVLLAGAGLLGLSLQRAMAVSPGFQSGHVLTGQILLPWADYSDVGRLTFVESLMDKMGRLPGVLSAGVVTNVPFSGNS